MTEWGYNQTWNENIEKVCMAICEAGYDVGVVDVGDGILALRTLSGPDAPDDVVERAKKLAGVEDVQTSVKDLVVRRDPG